MSELWAWSAEDISAAIKRRELSAREFTEAALARIETVNPSVNAIVEITGSEALAAADAADQAVKNGETLGCLHGVPITTKVNADQQGCATTNGLVASARLVAKTDSPVIANLKKAGAIIIGRTNTPAFSLRWFTENDLHGRTLNPWRSDVSPGGSSGGASSALAVGMGAIAHGNDYGGSIRHPALMCGVVGLRPSYGRVPAYNASAATERTISSQLYSVQGPLARNVTDCGIALNAMATSDVRDPYHVDVVRARSSAAAKRVAVMRGCGFASAPPEVSAAIETAAKSLQDAGYHVEGVTPPHFEEATEIWRQTVFGDVHRTMSNQVLSLGDEYVRTNLRLVHEGMTLLDGDGLLDLYARRLAIARAWSEFFETYPILLTATSWRHGLRYGDDQTTADDLTALILDQSPLLATAMLGLPGLSLPTGLAGGLPTGVQLVGRWHDEETLIKAGLAIEAVCPKLTPIEPVKP